MTVPRREEGPVISPHFDYLLPIEMEILDIGTMGLYVASNDTQPD